MQIYVLNNKNNIPFYIGKSNNPSHRLYNHIKTYGNDISLEIIDECSDNDWKFWERYWICQFKAWGFQLTNKNKGGGGPNQGRILRPKDNEWKLKLSNSHKNKKVNNSTKEKMSLAKKGKPSGFIGKKHNLFSKNKIRISKLNKPSSKKGQNKLYSYKDIILEKYQYLTIPQIAKELSLSKTTLWRFLKQTKNYEFRKNKTI